jgi:hypothetical protein
MISGDETPMIQELPENIAPDGESFDPPEHIEPVKQAEPKLRGSLADSIARQTTDQPTANTNKGPSRI